MTLPLSSMSRRPRHPEALRLAGASALVVALLLSVAMAFQGIFPFGDRALSWADGPIQYAGFLGWFHRVLTGQADLQYSFSAALGGETFPLFAYYLSSPFSLLAAFFDTRDAMRLLTLLWPLKLVVASGTCGYYLSRRYRLGMPVGISLSASYALAPWMLIHGTCIMWLDGVYMLPIVCLGVWKLVRGGSPATMYAGIGLSVLFNWYAGYMCCAFAVLQFVVDLASLGAPETVRPVRLCLRFAVALGLGAALGGVMLITTLRFMSANPVQSEASGISYLLSVPVADWVLNGPLKLMSGLALDGRGIPGLGLRYLDMTAVPSYALPVLLLACACALPLDDKRRREKLAWTIGALCLGLCLMLLPLNLALTGFSLAESYNPRFMFLLLMALVHGAALTLSPAETCDLACVKKTVLSGMAGVLVVLLLPVAFYPSLVESLPGRVGEALASAVLLVALGVGGALRGHTDIGESDPVARDWAARRWMPVAGALITGVGLVLTAAPCMSHAAPSSISLRDAYFDAQGNALVSGVDAAFFRAESLDSGSAAVALGTRSENATGSDHFGMGVNGLAHYSSTSYRNVNTLLGKLGYCYTPTHRNMTWYASSILASDSLLGIRYLLAPSAPAGMDLVRTVDMPEPYGPGWGLYENDRALPLGFGVLAASKSVSWGTESWWNSDAFENQQSLFASYVGHGLELYSIADEWGVIPEEDALGDDAVAKAHWLVTAPGDGPLYVAQHVPIGAQLAVSVDGRFLQTAGSWAFDTNVIYLGDYEKGAQVELELALLDPDSRVGFVPSEVRFVAATLNLAALDAALNELRARPFEPSVLRDGHVEGDYLSSGTDKLLLTIPYDVGWRVQVDGVPAQAEELDGLMCIELEEGPHHISMRYVTPGLRLGLAVSVGSLAIFCGWRLLVARKGRKVESS